MHEIAWVWPWQVFKKESSMMINLPFISRCSFKRWKIAVLPKSSWKIGWKEKKKLYNFWKRKFNRQFGDFHIWKRKGFCVVVLLIDVILILINGTFYGGPWATIFRFLYSLWLLQSAVAQKSLLKICGGSTLTAYKLLSVSCVFSPQDTSENGK